LRLSQQITFLLHRRAYGERSLLVELWTREHGRLPAIARQVRGGSSERSASLAPFNRLQAELSGRGDVMTLTRWEVEGAPMMLRGSVALAGMYVNELLARLLARGDPNPELFDHYAMLISSLSAEPRTDWLLRRFEKQLLDQLGYGLNLEQSADGRPIEAAGRYLVDLDRGVREIGTEQGYSGAALLALGAIESEQPSSAICNEQRKLLRAIFLDLLAGRPLSTWQWSQALSQASAER